jgi:hypothetical protein
MGSGRTFNKTNITRPRKGGARKTNRQNTQRKRLLTLGADPAVVAKLNPREVRDLLKRPAELAAK